VIVGLRRLRFTAGEIAEALGMALSTLSGILRRLGLGRLGRIGLERPLRYERSRPGELVHVDVKRLGRIQGGAGKRVRDGRCFGSNPRKCQLRRVIFCGFAGKTLWTASDGIATRGVGQIRLNPSFAARKLYHATSIQRHL
jgi:hypothetical protein